VARRVQRHPHSVDIEGPTVGHGLNRRVLGEARPKDARSFGAGEVMAAAPRDVVAVRVSDHGAVHRAPGIDVEFARLAVEAVWGETKKRHPRGALAIRSPALPRRTRPELRIRRRDP
jgi:hypothetical protein